MVRPRPASVYLVFIVTGFLFVVGGGEGVDAGVLDDVADARVGAGAGGVADPPGGGVEPLNCGEAHLWASLLASLAAAWSAASVRAFVKSAFMTSSGWRATMRPAMTRARMHLGITAHARRWRRPWRPP
nr:MAG TPA: hypothetical protein [Caudoviricetes sp.]